jgi:hypothetical protein
MTAQGDNRAWLIDLNGLLLGGKKTQLVENRLLYKTPQKIDIYKHIKSSDNISHVIIG